MIKNMDQEYLYKTEIFTRDSFEKTKSTVVGFNILQTEILLRHI